MLVADESRLRPGTLSATSRCSCVSWARNTRPNPPSPSSRRILYRPIMSGIGSGASWRASARSPPVSRSLSRDRFTVLAGPGSRGGRLAIMAQPASTAARSSGNRRWYSSIVNASPAACRRSISDGDEFLEQCATQRRGDLGQIVLDPGTLAAAPRSSNARAQPVDLLLLREWQRLVGKLTLVRHGYVAPYFQSNQFAN